MLKIFCLLTGDDYNIVRHETPASRKKISLLGSVLFIPVILWFIIGYNMASSFLHLSTTSAVFTGMCTGVIILILERTIIMTGKSIMLASMRIVLGFLMATLGAVFLDEIIFSDDIDQQVFLDREELIGNEREHIEDLYLIRIQDAKSRVSDSYQEWVTALEDAKNESDGSGGSGVRGIHSITKLKLDISQQHEANYKLALQELTKLEESMANDHLTIANKIENKITGKSILFRIKSLFSLLSKDSYALGIYSLFTAFLFLLEFIVIIMKYNIADTNYDCRVAAMETVGKRRLKAISERDEKIFDPADSSREYHRAERRLASVNTSMFGT